MRPILAIIFAAAATAQTATVIIVDASHRDAANQAALTFDPIGGTNTFNTPLVTAGTTNVVAYWCATGFSATNRALLSQMVSNPPFAGHVWIGDYDITADPGFPFRVLQTNGLAPAEIQP